MSQVETGLINAGSYGDEVVIGKWGNSDLYRKVVNTGALTANTTKTVSSGLSNITVRRIYGDTQSSSYMRPIPYAFDTGDGIQVISALYDYANNNVLAKCFGSVTDSNIVLEYTKNPTTRDGDDTKSEPEPETKK